MANQQYNPVSEYVLLQVADNHSFESEVRDTLPSRYLLYVEEIEYSGHVKPSQITPIQIRKRLNRMIQEGVRMLVLDTSQPDFMGKNLQKWLLELKRLERQGKYISVMIDSADEKVYQSLPDDLKADVLPIRLERLSPT